MDTQLFSLFYKQRQGSRPRLFALTLNLDLTQLIGIGKITPGGMKYHKYTRLQTRQPLFNIGVETIQRSIQARMVFKVFGFVQRVQPDKSVAQAQSHYLDQWWTQPNMRIRFTLCVRVIEIMGVSTCRFHLTQLYPISRIQQPKVRMGIQNAINPNLFKWYAYLVIEICIRQRCHLPG